MLQIRVWRTLERENCEGMRGLLRVQVNWRSKGALPNARQSLLLRGTRYRPFAPLWDSNERNMLTKVFIKKGKGGVAETRILVAGKTV